MGYVSSTTAEWLLEISGLTVAGRDGTPGDIVVQGRALALQVRSAAAAHAGRTACQPGACAGDCPLTTVDGGPAACQMARVLAQTSTSPAVSDPQRAAALYLQALQAAATAVFHCRRHAHPAGECWFSDDTTEHCGDVLAVAHRLGC
ncbi:hypothetical protein BH23ACT9_BH23ACT9_08500 [soil metagenome]